MGPVASAPARAEEGDRTAFGSRQRQSELGGLVNSSRVLAAASPTVPGTLSTMQQRSTRMGTPDMRSPSSILILPFADNSPMYRGHGSISSADSVASRMMTRFRMFTSAGDPQASLGTRLEAIQPMRSMDIDSDVTAILSGQTQVATDSEGQGARHSAAGLRSASLKMGRTRHESDHSYVMPMLTGFTVGSACTVDLPLNDSTCALLDDTSGDPGDMSPGSPR